MIVITPSGSQVDISSGDEDYDDSDYPWIQDGSNTRWIAIIARYGGCNFEQKVKETFREKMEHSPIYNECQAQSASQVD